MKLSRLKIVNIYKVLEGLVKDGSVKPFVFKYVSKKIRELLKLEVDAVAEVEPKLRSEYQGKVNQILVENAEKDETGNPKTVNNSNLIKDLIIPAENKAKIAVAIEALNSSFNHEEAIKEEAEFEKFMLEEIEVDLPKFTTKDLWDGISDEAIEVLFDLIVEA